MPLKTQIDEPPALNLTAMLDVMFLLIIFFMLGTRLADDERRIALAGARGRRPRRPGRRRGAKTVNVYRDGTITLDGQTVTLEQLGVRLAAARGRQRSLGVLVRGDAEGQFQQVAAVLNACKQAGVGELGISVRFLALKK